MPLNFINDSIDVTDLKGYIMCFPAIALKDTSEKDPDYISELYTKYPDANYYQQHASGNRGQVGTIKIHHLNDEGDQCQGIINVFNKIYPNDDKTYPNDNPVTRIKYFKAAIEKLLELPTTIDTMHAQLPVSCSSELMDYRQVFEDFISTYNLEHSVDIKLNIYIRDLDVPDKVPISTIKSNVARTPKSIPRVANTRNVQASASASTYKLVFEQDQVINTQPLYEADFYPIKMFQ